MSNVAQDQFGYEVIEQLPGIAKQWADIERKRPKEAMAQPKLSLG